MIDPFSCGAYWGRGCFMQMFPMTLSLLLELSGSPLQYSETLTTFINATLTGYANWKLSGIHSCC